MSSFQKNATFSIVSFRNQLLFIKFIYDVIRIVLLSCSENEYLIVLTYVVEKSLQIRSEHKHFFIIGFGKMYQCFIQIQNQGVFFISWNLILNVVFISQNLNTLSQEHFQVCLLLHYR